MTGFIRFDGKISRDNTSSGDQEVTIGGITIKVDFPEKEVGVQSPVQFKTQKLPQTIPKFSGQLQ